MNNYLRNNLAGYNIFLQQIDNAIEWINADNYEDEEIELTEEEFAERKIGYYVETTKTESGRRELPMTPEVEACFKRILEKRRPPALEPMIDGFTGFWYFDKDGRVMHALHWQKYFQHIREKYNKIYRVQMPIVTPHVCRHTYCTNMAKSGMNPKTLQYLMGHSDISTTLDIYTDATSDFKKKEMFSFEEFINKKNKED